MGVGQNYVLDKGFLATGATAYVAGNIGALAAGSGSFASTFNTVGLAGLNPTGLMVVVMEDLDTVRLATGKAFINCALSGLVRVKCGATVTAGSRVTSDATSRAVNSAQTGTAPAKNVLGIALTGNTVGLDIDVLLTPGAVF